MTNQALRGEPVALSLIRPGDPQVENNRTSDQTPRSTCLWKAEETGPWEPPLVPVVLSKKRLSHVTGVSEKGLEGCSAPA